MQTLGLSSTTPKPTSRLRELLWPDVSDEVGARTAAHLAVWASFIIAGVSAAFVVGGAAPKEGLVDCVLFVLIGFGIHRLSRVAAVSGLALYVAEHVYAIVEGTGGFGIVGIIVTFLFLSSVRGAFGYHRQRQRHREAPDTGLVSS